MSRGNISIFTGSNMAGKSTTLKALTLAVWLAHCGLPVPVKSMVCPLYEGIYTSINLPDSLRDGRKPFHGRGTSYKRSDAKSAYRKTLFGRLG